jgi:hypothetical protein
LFVAKISELALGQATDDVRAESLRAFICDCFMSFAMYPPNTALEPTADSAFRLAGSAGFATRQFGGGSAFVR